MIYKSSCYDETLRIARRFAESLKSGDVVRLWGDVGAGKTAFVSGAAEVLCGPGTPVSSPTFSIMNIYKGDVPVYHFDLYRISDFDEIYHAGLSDYIGRDSISFVEWPQLLDVSEFDRVFDITVKRNLEISDEYREIEIDLHSEAEETNENSCN